ncbi:MAG: hypothetical protein K6G54_00080 [Oscillospiraceae bacterium]|nr:hypothetical protein [Oscillospiraceae bacterium]
MAGRKKNRVVPEENRTTADYYKLHTDAVRDLAEADESNSPEVSESELLKYRSGSKIHLTAWAKAILIKMWFAGSVCFFIFWGLSAYITARLDLMLVFGIALGVVTDLLTNNILRGSAKTEHGNDRWMMFPKKRYAAFFFNILYAFVLLFCVETVYTLLNLLILAIEGEGARPLGVEPILFGIFYTGVDLLLLSMKRLLRRIVSDARARTPR